MLVNGIGAWLAGSLPGPQAALPTGDRLVIVVEPEDTVEFLFGQICDAIPVTFYPTCFDNEIGPLPIILDDSSATARSSAGSVRRSELPADMTYTELFHRMGSLDGAVPTTSKPRPELPQTDAVRSVHQRFSRTATHSHVKARAGDQHSS